MTTVPEPERQPPPARALRHLLRKDLRLLAGRDSLLALGVYLAVALQFMRHDEAFFWVSVWFAGALVTVVPLVEWLFDTDAMMSSLPVRRSTIVAARYSAAVAGCAAGAIVWIGSGWLLSPILASGGTGVVMWRTLAGVLTYLVVTSLFTSLFLPLYFSFGLGRGGLIFVILALVLVAASSVAFDRGEAATTGVILRLPAAAIRDRIGVLVTTLGTRPALVAVLTGLAAVLALSAWLSARGFRRRDL
jgi:hypothetical protein